MGVCCHRSILTNGVDWMTAGNSQFARLQRILFRREREDWGRMREISACVIRAPRSLPFSKTPRRI